MPDHSPAPWTLDQSDPGTPKGCIALCYERPSGGFNGIAEISRQYDGLDGSADANARLMVASPALLKESQNVVQYLIEFIADSGGNFIGRSASGALRKLKAAIDEATKEPTV